MKYERRTSYAIADSANFVLSIFIANNGLYVEMEIHKTRGPHVHQEVSCQDFGRITTS